jgi:glycosyltransferase involved in cell wall biosynthesis
VKLRILWNSEATYLSTGYSTYCREILKRLFATGKYDILEFASYGDRYDKRINDVPWDIYPVIPDRNNQEAVQQYNSHPINQFGCWKFEDICCDFKPHVVFDLRDFWMMAHEANSPYREYYNLVWMPTVDAYPQHLEWVEKYSQCDAIFTYSDWAIEVLRKQAGNKINIIGSTPPGADVQFKPVGSKLEHKKQFGLEKYNIVGTVMRNQRRKKFPDLMEAFKKFLDKSENKNTLLYLHTSFPDKQPWDIPLYINQFGLSTKVLMTYTCDKCKTSKPMFFSDYGTPCKDCGEGMLSTSNVHNGVNNETLAGIYNLFDVYIQYANSEGFGLPQCEAAACGVPVMSIDYSAMSDVVRKLKGVPLTPKALDLELETGCYRAVPDNDLTANELYNFFLLPAAVRLRKGFDARKAYDKHYGYDKSAARFEQYFDTLNVQALNNKWLSEPRILPIAAYDEMPTIDNQHYAEWLISHVLGEPKYIGSYMHSRLIKELNYSTSLGGLGGIYLNEDTFVNSEPKHIAFTRQNAYEHFASMARMRNHWEKERYESLVHKSS